MTSRSWDLLRDFWHPVALSADVKDKPVAVKLLDYVAVDIASDAYGGVSKAS